MKLESFKEALEKSIKQWEWITRQPGKTSKEDYFRSHPNILRPDLDCYLCQWRHQNTHLLCDCCVDYLVWQNKDTQPCIHSTSPYETWIWNKTAVNAAKVRDCLKAALKRVETKK